MLKLPAALAIAACATFASAQQQPLLTGQSAFTDWSQQAPGVRHKITLADLPQPDPSQSVGNQPNLIPRPSDAWPIAPAGFKVTLYAGGDAAPLQRKDNTEHMRLSGGTFTQPRIVRTAPNGDIFLADTGAGTIFVLRGATPDGKAATIEKFATGLDHPFGIAFYPNGPNPKYIYVGNATTIQRFAYTPGDLHATGAPETMVPDIPGYAQLQGGGHSSRDVVFTKDNKHMLVSVGSASNVDDADTHPKEFHRADVLEFSPEGKFEEVYASGIRNCVGEAINPVTGALWCSTNERDELGNHLVPDYVTSVPEHSFFGWPWYYMGGTLDPRLHDPCTNGPGGNQQLSTPLTADEAKNCKHIDLSKKVVTPDVLVQPHMASLEMTFYPEHTSTTHDWPKRPGSDSFKGETTQTMPSAFPAQFKGGAFAAEHGSWNRDPRAGYEVIFIPLNFGESKGEYDDFLTGFVTKTGQVWGRPVGVTVANDGSLIVVDDGSRSVWRVTYTGTPTTTASTTNHEPRTTNH
jgi:glucose/arabinose dehydrogenase